MQVAISGAMAYRGQWAAFGEFRDVLASDSGEVSLLGGQSTNTVGNGFLLTFALPGKLVAGQYPIQAYQSGTTPTAPIAFLLVNDTTLFASVPGGSVVVESAVYPERPGLEPGVLRGTLTFRAVRLGPGSVATGDTILVHSTFAAHWYHYLRPNVSVTLAGDGPVLGTSLRAVAQSVDDDHGGRLVFWDADFDGLPGPVFPFEIAQEFRLAAPAVGAFSLAGVTPEQHADPAQWPAAFSALFYRDDARTALSTGGTLTITRYVAPTDAFYGEIHGTLTSPLALWASDSVTSDTANVSVTFAVQLWPLGGIPSSAPLRLR